MENKDNLLGVVETVLKHSRYIVITCLIVGIGAVVISLLLPVYYKASTIFLAASPDQAMPERIFGTSTTSLQYFGNNNDNDRLLTIAESSELANYLIDKFDLYDHYGIDSTAQRARFKIQEKFFGLFEVQKTKRDAIQLTVEDKDPEMAAAIANEARVRIDIMASSLIKATQARLMQTFRETIEAKETQIEVVSDSIQAFRERYSIYNTEAQSESLSSLLGRTQSKLARSEARLRALQTTNVRVDQDSIAFLKATVEGLKEEFNSLQSQADQLNQGMSKVEALNEEHQQAVLQVSYDKERLKQIQAAYNSDVSAVILVEAAAVPIIKSRPKRAILVLAAVAIAFVFSLIAVLLLETYKDVDWKRLADIARNNGTAKKEVASKTPQVKK